MFTWWLGMLQAIKLLLDNGIFILLRKLWNCFDSWQWHNGSNKKYNLSMLFVVCCILLYEICIYHKQAAIAREWACVKIEHHCHLYFLLQMKMFKLYKVSHLISPSSTTQSKDLPSGLVKRNEWLRWLVPLPLHWSSLKSYLMHEVNCNVFPPWRA